MKFLILPTFALLFVACDSGDIYPEENQNFANIEVDATFSFSNLNAFPEQDYQILFGCFEENTAKPITSKTIQKAKNENEPVFVSMEKIPINTKYIRLVLSNIKTGTTVFTFFEKELENIPAEKITIKDQNINLLQYKRIQQQVFSQCIQCHGGSERAAAGLYLTEGKSYDHLYQIRSKTSTKLRVEPFSVANSYIMDVLKEKTLVAPHTSIFTTISPDDITLIEEWIKTGAENIIK